MDYLTTVHTDIGIKKNTNQDSVLVEQAFTDYGSVVLGVICDGMGGLAKGEVASAALIRAFGDWFHYDFPKLLYQGLDLSAISESWTELIRKNNKKIAEYGNALHISLGTTVTALLLVEGAYYIVNVGDSRVYLLNRELKLLTKDQTVVQREIDLGNITPAEAATHPQRNVLLQCIGASAVVQPDFYEGSYAEGDMFMICSDGFRHVITEQEIYDKLNPYVLTTEDQMKEAAADLTELNKSRNETDNISVSLIRVS